MKIAYLLSGLLLLGCDARRGHENVIKAFPGGDVKSIPSEVSRFLVKDTNGNIWYVESTGFSDGVFQNLMFKGE